MRAHLEGAELDRAHLEEAQLEHAHLDGANLAGAHLQGANLAGAHLDGAQLAGARLQGARADDRTSWPAGFDWRSAGVMVIADNTAASHQQGGIDGRLGPAS